MLYGYILEENWIERSALEKIYATQTASRTHGGNGLDKYSLRREELFSFADLSKILSDRKAKNIILYGQRLTYLCRKLSEQYHVFNVSVDGIGMKEYFFNPRISMFCNYRAYTEDAMGTFLKSDEKGLVRIKKRITTYLKRIKPELILTTSFTPRRIFDVILYETAKEYHIPVVLLEHGFMANTFVSEYGRRKYTYLANRWYDFYWYWTRRNQEIYNAAQGTDIEKSFVLGYPAKPLERDEHPELSILFVGESLVFDSYGDEKKFSEYYKMINEVYRICHRVGLPFKYKAHSPEKEVERIEKYLLPEIEQTYDFYGELRKNLITIGIRTSALVEAGAIGNYVIQIDYNHDEVKNFIWAHSYLLKNFQEELEPLLRKIMEGKIQPKQISADEFFQPESILEQFNKGLEQVKAQYHAS